MYVGYSGLIYAAIVAAWAAFLVPRWVRRNEEIDQAAETDAARRVRVLQRRTTVRGHGRAGGTVLHGSSDGLVVGAASEPSTDSSDVAGDTDPATPRKPNDPVAVVDRTFASAARRRRRNLTVLVAALVTSVVATVANVVPSGVPVVVAATLVAFLLVGRRAAVAQAQRRRVALRRAAEAARRAAEADEDADDDGVELTEDGKRVAVFEPQPEPEADPDSWQPVAVPRPTYLDKAAAPTPPGRAINLETPGSWTSGRLDPAGSIELPPKRREPIVAPTASSHDAPAEPSESEAADEEVYPEHRRAVGD